MTSHLSPEHLARDLALRDLSDPADGPHAIQQLVDVAVDALVAAWGCRSILATGPRVVPVADNYDNLNFTRDAASRDARYTRYVDDASMLRSHSSAMVPPALRELAASPHDDDVLLVCPGVVYRRDSIDRLHTGTPHQLDLWRIARDPMTEDDMDEMTQLLSDALVPGREYRVEARVHPYTLRGRQVDVLHNGEWVEVWECGLAHPAVLARAGLDESWSGLALGLGLDRFLMLRKGVPDIRLLRSVDARIASQMLDLRAYTPVSTMPAVRRDISVAVEADDDVESLGDRVRDALGDDADAVESVVVQASTDYAALPPAAIDRMGMRVGQKNVLVRIVLRHLERTLTDAEANALRDRIYAALHEGDVHEWAATPSRP